MDSTRYTQRVSTKRALELNEEFRKDYFSDPRFLKAWQQRKKCEVEFVF